MMFSRVKATGLLSFGPTGLDLPLEKLNVLIGPNGSGKSNLLEVLNLVRVMPTNLPAPVKEMGGIKEWLWKPGGLLKGAATEAKIEVIADYPQSKTPIRHVLAMTDHGGRFEVVDENIENEKPLPGHADAYFFYRFQRGRPALNEKAGKGKGRELKRESVNPEQSILAQVRDPERYPELAWLQRQYEQIRLFRNWWFGPNAPLRREQSTHGRSDFLVDGGENLALVLSKILPYVKQEFLASLEQLYGGIRDVHLPIEGGNVLLFLEEGGGRQIAATRLSDGTLRYLCLLAILLHPDPPPLVAIEEPELGLHPDVIHHLADLLVRASERTQLIVTSHSRILIDALSDHPSSVIVCSNENGESTFERLDAGALEVWLEKYSLGELWSSGELGGNRW